MSTHDRLPIDTPHDGAPTRRRLLTIAAGGFAALSSGLLLPGAIGDVEATKKARRRKKRERRERDKPRGSSLNPITFHVQNMLPIPLEIAYWEKKDELSDDRWIEPRGAKTETLPANPSHSSSDDYVKHHTSDWPGLLIWNAAHGLMVSAVNAFILAPMVTIGKNGNVAVGDGWTNGSVVMESRMSEGSTEVREVQTDITVYVKVQRLNDRSGRKIYSITFDDRAP
jgi:hypothetical protein